MAGHQCHFVEVGDIPRRNDHAARIGIRFQLLQYLADLVDVTAIGRGPRAPLVAINRAEVAIRFGPFIPDRDAVVLQVFDVGVALQKPQQFMDDRLQVYLLGGHQRKAGVQVEAQLSAEH